MGAVQAANLAVRFGLELTALGILGYWGLHAWAGSMSRIAMAVLAPLLMAMAWGLLASPQAPVALATPVKVAVQLALFALPVLALVHLARPVLATGFGAVVVANATLMLWWQQ